MNKKYFLKILLLISAAGFPFSAAEKATGQTPTIFAPGIISGPAHDASPAFTPNGKTVYFSRSNTSVSTILVSHLRSGKWSQPEIAPFSGVWRDLEPTMAPDGSYMIFISSRPADGQEKQLDGFFNNQTQPGLGGNLWRVNLTGANVNKPVRLPDNVNRSPSVFAPSIARNGSLYFMETSGEKRKFRIFRSQFANGTYQAPETVSFSTGEFGDFDPAVAPDESFVIFSSPRPGAQSTDLYISFRKNGAWGEPVNMGTEANSAASDVEARLSPDGKTVYFSNNRTLPITFPRTIDSANRDLARIQEWDDGNTNIWQFSLTEWLNKHKTDQQIN